MSTPVPLPALGESVTEGTVSRWLKQVGDTVEVDEPIVEVSTDKVDTEIPSPAAGVILEIKVAEDETAAVGAVLAVIGDAFGDLLRAWKPLKHVGNMLGGSSGAASSAMGAFLGAKAQTPMGRMLIALAGIVLPAMADRVAQGTAGRDRLRQELGVSWARVKQYLNERRKAHQEHRTE